jgi:hypothetical protein
VQQIAGLHYCSRQAQGNRQHPSARPPGKHRHRHFRASGCALRKRIGPTHVRGSFVRLHGLISVPAADDVGQGQNAADGSCAQQRNRGRQPPSGEAATHGSPVSATPYCDAQPAMPPAGDARAGGRRRPACEDYHPGQEASGEEARRSHHLRALCYSVDLEHPSSAVDCCPAAAGFVGAGTRAGWSLGPSSVRRGLMAESLTLRWMMSCSAGVSCAPQGMACAPSCFGGAM